MLIVCTWLEQAFENFLTLLSKMPEDSWGVHWQASFHSIFAIFIIHALPPSQPKPVSKLELHKPKLLIIPTPRQLLPFLILYTPILHHPNQLILPLHLLKHPLHHRR